MASVAAWVGRRQQAHGARAACRGKHAGFLAGCGAPAPSAPTSTATLVPAAKPTVTQPVATAVPIPPTPAATSGGTIRTGQVGDIANLDGHYSNQLSNNTVQLAYDELVAHDESLQPRPVLAESWAIGSDLKQFRLSLRKGVQFHNRRDFTSNDVKYNIMPDGDPKMAGIVAGRTLKLRSTEQDRSDSLNGFRATTSRWPGTRVTGHPTALAPTSWSSAFCAMRKRCPHNSRPAVRTSCMPHRSRMLHA